MQEKNQWIHWNFGLKKLNERNEKNKMLELGKEFFAVLFIFGSVLTAVMLGASWLISGYFLSEEKEK